MKLKAYVDISRRLPGKTIVPKGCIIHRITLNSKGVAEIGFRCGDEGGQKTFPQPGGGVGTFRAKRLKGIFTVSHRGINISAPEKGEVRIGFVLSPAHAVCKRDAREIICTLKGDKSLPSLQGTKRKRRR